MQQPFRFVVSPEETARLRHATLPTELWTEIIHLATKFAADPKRYQMSIGLIKKVSKTFFNAVCDSVRILVVNRPDLFTFFGKLYSPKLTTLTILYQGLHYLTPLYWPSLRPFTALTDLYIHFSSATPIEFDNLTQFTKLTKLRLEFSSSHFPSVGSWTRQYEALGKITSLRHLEMSLPRWEIGSTLGLGSLTFLRSLALVHTQHFEDIADFGCLAPLQHLTDLSLTWFKLAGANMTPITALTSLQSLSLTPRSAEHYSLPNTLPKLASLRKANLPGKLGAPEARLLCALPALASLRATSFAFGPEIGLNLFPTLTKLVLTGPLKKGDLTLIASLVALKKLTLSGTLETLSDLFQLTTLRDLEKLAMPALGGGSWEQTKKFFLHMNLPKLYLALDGNQGNLAIAALQANDFDFGLQLIDSGVYPIRATTWGKLSLLYLAVKSGRADLVQKLLQLGADVTVNCPGGTDVVAIARNSGHEDLARILAPLLPPAKIDEDFQDGMSLFSELTDN